MYLESTDNLRCIMGSRDQWEFPPLFKGHWQSPNTALTAGDLPAVRAVEGGCGLVYKNDNQLDSCHQLCNKNATCLSVVLYRVTQ